MIRLERNINPTREHINEWKVLENGMIANKYAILSTSIVCYELWVQSSLMGIWHPVFTAP